jgi:hypothetical protein
MIDISVCSRFHAFDLARELWKHGMLRHLHTGYPAFLTARFGVPASMVRSVWTGEPLNRVLGSLHRRDWIPSPYYYICERHDRIVASRLRPGAEIFVGWSGQCLRTIKTARAMGMTTIVERGSSHIEWQRDQLIEEARLIGLQLEVPHPRTIEQELAEYEAAHYIAVPSAFVARTFVANGVPASKLLLNPYGVDLMRFENSGAVPEASGGPRTGLRVLHVGRVSARKGVHYLAEAVRRVPGATLTLVGASDGGVDARLSGSGIRLVGAVPGDHLPSWYRKADVFCLLSIEEGLALVIAQAMAMGLPVIATPNTGAEELIENGVHGFIVPARDPEAAAECLRQLDDSPELRFEMGARARARVADGFDWASYGARARAHYERISSLSDSVRASDVALVEAHITVASDRC